MKKIFKRINVAENYEKVQENIPALVKTVFAALFIMALSTLAVFFIRVKGAEQTLVPNVVGIQLEDAIVELQVKQLYPKIKLRYTDDGVEKGVVLEQSPSARSMVKGYSTVTLTVSRGPVQATVEDYVGKNVKDLKIGDEQLAYGDNKSVLKFDYDKVWSHVLNDPMSLDNIIFLIDNKYQINADNKILRNVLT